MFCFTSGRSRTLDSFNAGNRRQARKDLIFRAFSACLRIPRERGIVKKRPGKSKKSTTLPRPQAEEFAAAASGRIFLHPTAGCDILIVEKGKARDTQPTLNNDYLIT